MEIFTVHTGDFKQDLAEFKGMNKVFIIDWDKVKYVGAGNIGKQDSDALKIKLIDIFSKQPDYHIRLNTNNFVFKLPTSDDFNPLSKQILTLLKFIVAHCKKAAVCHNLQQVISSPQFALHQFDSMELYDNYNEWMLMQSWR